VKTVLETVIQRPPWTDRKATEPLVTREWLVTNGLGGYASGTLSGIMTRKYHGYLVAALPSPIGRLVALQNLGTAVLLADGEVAALSGEERHGRDPEIPALQHLREFRLEMGLPVWEFEIDGRRIEKRVVMPYGQNSVHVIFRLLAGDRVELALRPAMHFRSYEAPVTTPQPGSHRLVTEGERFEVLAGEELPPLRMTVAGAPATFVADSTHVTEVFYRLERDRGYEAVGSVWTPGHFRVGLTPAVPITFIASTESWDVLGALEPGAVSGAERERRLRLLTLSGAAADDEVGARLVLAADQFIVTPTGRAEDGARARAAGDEARTVIAGYHWFTDWGRDTMISLEGLTLATGRHREGGYILRTFAHYVREGLIPNMFPDGANDGLYHTADATLWFFHALARYVDVTGDRDTLRRLLPTMRDIADHHLAGTRFGIAVDRGDGLLRAGAEGYQLTWMDAKCDGWVVTPRRGKPVEINALWYNALSLVAQWVTAEEGARAGAPYLRHAEQARESFNRRFWFEDGGHLYDVVDGEQGDDPACRPNQLLGISLAHPVLDRGRWEPVMNVVERKLLTPYGLRSLSPDHPDYQPGYSGDLRTRDAAYHQGTVWTWLIGPFIDAWLRVHPGEEVRARELLHAIVGHLDEFGVGTIAEIFDAEPPHAPRGCIAQAWSVAETLRSWLNTRPREAAMAEGETRHAESWP
jgi:predicted glycogen debranching enzyme